MLNIVDIVIRRHVRQVSLQVAGDPNAGSVVGDLPNLTLLP
jgi:hypothetical protein